MKTHRRKTARPQPLPLSRTGPSGEAKNGPPKPAAQRTPGKGPVLDPPVHAGDAVPDAAPLPTWIPRDFQLERAAAAVARFLEAQGTDVQALRGRSLQHVDIVDFDHTCARTNTACTLLHRATGEPLLHPDTGRPWMVGSGRWHDPDLELGEARQAHPEIPWDDYRLDYSPFNTPDSVRELPPIEETLSTLKEHGSASGCFINTARAGAMLTGALKTWMERNGVPTLGVLLASNAELLSDMGLADAALSTGQRKALLNAALLHLCLPDSSSVYDVRYVDDTDDNTRRSMEALPRLLPNVRFRFFDVVREEGHYTQRLVAQSDPLTGALLDPQLRPLSTEDLLEYRSDDRPLGTGA